MFYRFPDNFIWGAATAAIQIEGSPQANGGGYSVWDEFCRRPGAIANDDNIQNACDHFHKFEEDVKLLQDLGVKAYRFSIAWPRIIPDGDGQVNLPGLDFYQRLTDTLLAHNIEPYATIFHWETPLALEERFGGWRSKHTAQALGRFAGVVSAALSDRIKHFFTTNEIICFTAGGYENFGKAPGLCCDRRTVNQTIYNGVLGHAMAVQGLREHARGPIEVGLAENIEPCMPLLETNEDIKAALDATKIRNADRLDLILNGSHAPEYLDKAGTNAPQSTPEELKLIGQKLDFVGLNVYNGPYVRHADNTDGYEVLPYQQSYPKALVDWYPVSPDAPYWGLRFVNEFYPEVKNLYITEMGCPALDVQTPQGEILDTERILLLRSYLRSVQRAAAEQIPVKGCFLWSLMDNFEWQDGYSKRFGLIYVNYSTQQRIPKASFKFYRETIRQNSIV